MRAQVTAPAAGGASCLPSPPTPARSRAPRGAGERRQREGGVFPEPGRGSQAVGPGGAKQGSGSFKGMPGVGQGKVGRGRERRTCWNFFFPREALSGLE